TARNQPMPRRRLSSLSLRATWPLLLAATCLADDRPGGATGPPVASPSHQPLAELPFPQLPVATIDVDLASDQGPLEGWRHTVGHGGINPRPLLGRVVEGAVKLRPRLIRVFIQEFFAIYPDHGRFDWSRLDPYMDALAATGAKVVAAITIKPRPL